ncbi:hypothetical protein BCW_C0005 (plasmid) [Bacillus cereus W]|nr:hypothetical protein BCW_C0005 [Bacillus cereus W]
MIFVSKYLYWIFMFANDMNNKLFLSIFECKLFIISLHSNPLNY